MLQFIQLNIILHRLSGTCPTALGDILKCLSLFKNMYSLMSWISSCLSFKNSTCFQKSYFCLFSTRLVQSQGEPAEFSLVQTVLEELYCLHLLPKINMEPWTRRTVWKTHSGLSCTICQILSQSQHSDVVVSQWRLTVTDVVLKVLQSCRGEPSCTASQFSHFFHFLKMKIVMQRWSLTVIVNH